MKLKFLIRSAFILLFLVFITKTNFSQSVSKAGTTSGDFLQIGVGAVGNAMGGAFVSLSKDASALYWNVSGIAVIGKLFTFLMDHIQTGLQILNLISPDWLCLWEISELLVLVLPRYLSVRWQLELSISLKVQASSFLQMILQ